MNIILIGYMGSGKTSLGKKLAKRMNLRFIDTDKLIEEREKSTISDLFQQHGEAAFRQMEKELVEELMLADNMLISTGGGMPCFNNLMEKLNDLGTTVYLKRPSKELANRIFNSKKKRPITDGKSMEELVVLIEQMIQLRSEFYERAHIIADRSIQSATSLELVIKAFIQKTK